MTNLSLSFPRAEIEPHYHAGKAISVLGTLKEGQRGQEVVIHGKVQASSRQFDVDAEADEAPVLVEELVRIASGQRVDVTIKVVSAGDIRPVTKRNGTVADKCELLVGDSTGTCRFALWEEQVRQRLRAPQVKDWFTCGPRVIIALG